jgi:hypothetical protein
MDYNDQFILVFYKSGEFVSKNTDQHNKETILAIMVNGWRCAEG